MHPRISTTVLLPTLLLGALAAPQAQAAFVMILDDPNDAFSSVMITDGTGGDLNGVNGVITFSGVVGAFTVNVTTGISKPVVGPGQLNLNSINVSGSAGTLLVSISDTDFLQGSSNYAASYGGTTQGSVDFSFLRDLGNAAFAGNQFASGSFSASPGNFAFENDIVSNVDAGAPFSLSILAQINHAGNNQVTSFDAAISPVPLPASVWLLGSALAGFGVFRRKKPAA